MKRVWGEWKGPASGRARGIGGSDGNTNGDAELGWGGAATLVPEFQGLEDPGLLSTVPI